nr:hypothetical protein [Bacteroidales bacterium]
VDMGAVECGNVEYNSTAGNVNLVVFRDGSWSHPESPEQLALTTVTFNKDTGEILDTSRNDGLPAYQDVFGKTLLELARANNKIVGITPAMPTGCSMTYMMNEMPSRTFDVGIAEQHAVTFSAGLAAQGLVPFCNIYSSFMQRAYDQVIHDVALQKLPVIFCLDRGGLVGADGATHHGFFDLSFMRTIPNMIVAAPMDEIELRNMMYTAQLPSNRKPFSIRYPRGRAVHADWQKPFETLDIGRARQLSEGGDLAILTIGHPGNAAAAVVKKLAAKGIAVAHWDMRFAAPLDKDTLHFVFRHHRHIITVEDGILTGGFGSAVLEFMADEGYNAEVLRLGIPNYFVEHGTQDELYKECGYDEEGIELAVREIIVRKGN